MEAGIVIKIAMVGIIVAVLSQVLSRAGRDDYALITVLAGYRRRADNAPAVSFAAARCRERTARRLI